MKGVGQKCGQKGSELIAQAIAFVTWFWGDKKAWVHENLRPFSLV